MVCGAVLAVTVAAGYYGNAVIGGVVGDFLGATIQVCGRWCHCDTQRAPGCRGVELLGVGSRLGGAVNQRVYVAAAGGHGGGASVVLAPDSGLGELLVSW